jgi:hypothetical protein
VIVRDTAKQLACTELGTLYRALSADATTAYGLSPAFLVHDELGQVKGPKSELYEALETATAAQEDPLSIVISTQAPTDADLLSILIDDALAGHDPAHRHQPAHAGPNWTPSARRRSRRQIQPMAIFKTPKSSREWPPTQSASRLANRNFAILS